MKCSWFLLLSRSNREKGSQGKLMILRTEQDPDRKGKLMLNCKWRKD